MIIGLLHGFDRELLDFKTVHMLACMVDVLEEHMILHVQDLRCACSKDYQRVAESTLAPDKIKPFAKLPTLLKLSTSILSALFFMCQSVRAMPGLAGYCSV